eukprot:378214-Rhodomonas_salina.1
MPRWSRRHFAQVSEHSSGTCRQSRGLVSGRMDRSSSHVALCLVAVLASCVCADTQRIRSACTLEFRVRAVTGSAVRASGREGRREKGREKG